MKEYSTFVGLNLPISFVEKVEGFRKRYKIKTKTDSFQQLIDLALTVESKIGYVESISSEDLKTIKEQIENGQIVDYVMNMEDKKFQLLVNIIEEEDKARQRVKHK
jgi:hypothetical protein